MPKIGEGITISGLGVAYTMNLRFVWICLNLSRFFFAEKPWGAITDDVIWGFYTLTIKDDKGRDGVQKVKRNGDVINGWPHTDYQ